MPNEDDEDMHSTNYLYCRMAHNGRSRWTEVTNTESKGGEEPKCSSCFCLPDTQRIGCVRTTCPADQGTTSSPPPSVKKLHRRIPSQPQDQSHEVRRFGSFDECVKAHGGKASFKDDCNSCVCSSEGSVICTLMLCPPKPSATRTEPVGPTKSITNVAAIPTTSHSNEYNSYEQCVHANGGSATFKRICNDCWCLKGGAVGCTRKFCPYHTPALA
ncbi:hypothetical protein IW138_002378 [Coemansia sp. RSA 986]|nr:hypothetical protein LPJ74_001969 [Coemansia sp. RSA 1843]KAJ2090760.1 hypothetical protein IW138_002378 [Coemansia sp. RSA 986]